MIVKLDWYRNVMSQQHDEGKVFLGLLGLLSYDKSRDEELLKIRPSVTSALRHRLDSWYAFSPNANPDRGRRDEVQSLSITLRKRLARGDLADFDLRSAITINRTLIGWSERDSRRLPSV